MDISIEARAFVLSVQPNNQKYNYVKKNRQISAPLPEVVVSSGKVHAWRLTSPLYSSSVLHVSKTGHYEQLLLYNTVLLPIMRLC